MYPKRKTTVDLSGVDISCFILFYVNIQWMAPECELAANLVVYNPNVNWLLDPQVTQ